MIFNLFAQKQITDLENQIKGFNKTISDKDIELSDYKTSMEKALEQKAEFDKEKEAWVKEKETLNNTISELQKTIGETKVSASSKANKILSSLGLEEGSIPAEAKGSSSKETVMETLNGLKGTERAEFYKNNRAAIIAACKGI